MFILPEELFLLSLDDAHGLIHSSISSRLGPALAGALLAEICLRELVDQDDKGRIILVEEKLTGEDLLDDIIAALNSARKPHKAAYWIEEFSEHCEPFIRRLSAALENLGVIHRDGKRYRLAVPCPALGSEQTHAKYWLKTRLRKLAIQDYIPNNHDLTLLRLLQASGMSGLVFTKDERQSATYRIHQLVENQTYSFSGEQVLEHLLDVLPEFIQVKK